MGMAAQEGKAETAVAPPRGMSGFRERGADGTRLEAFVDAAFAFAVTLLVVSFDDVPGTLEELTAAMRKVPAFLAGFAVVAMFWAAHRRFSRRFGLEDGAVTLLSLLLVATVLVYIFPLRVLMSWALSIFTGGWAPTELQVDAAAEARAVYLIYGAGFLAMNAWILLMNLHALRLREALRLDFGERLLTRAECVVHAIMGGSALLSIALAMLLPLDRGWQWALPGLAYAALSVVLPAYGVLTGRAHDRLQSEAAR
jgi:uncharacterized membrane protein